MCNKVTVKDLAHMAGVLANGGINPITGKRILSRQIVRQVLSVMMSCGMYDAAGDWLTTVGIPAKSGVAGGIIGVLPAQVGLAVFSPKLDAHGNSVRGIEIFERLSQDMGLHLMEGKSSAQTVIQKRYQAGQQNQYIIYELKGALAFAEAEVLLRQLSKEPAKQQTLVLDLTDIAYMHSVANRMLVEAIERLNADGHPVIVIDPEQLLEKQSLHACMNVCIYQELSQIQI